MRELLLRGLLLAVVLVPLLLVSKSQGQKDAAGTVRAALKALPVYFAGFCVVALVMILLEMVFVG